MLGNYPKAFILHTDASRKGLEVVLYQKHGGGGNESMVESIVAYTTRALSAAEKNHHICAGELEFLALKWTITDQFRDYL